MESVQLSSGPVDYEDSGGDGSVIVFAGGLLMDATLWHDVVGKLPSHRCIVVVLPLGGHRRPMNEDADLSLHAIADLLAELASFDRPTLILWSKEDKVMPFEHGRRLAQIIPDTTLVEVEDAYTLLSLDCPDVVAHHVATFVAQRPARH